MSYKLTLDPSVQDVPRMRYLWRAVPWNGLWRLNDLVDYKAVSIQRITYTEMNRIDRTEVDAVTWPHDRFALLYVLRLRQNEHAWDHLIEGELI